MTQKKSPDAQSAPPPRDPVTGRAADAIRAVFPEALEEVVLEGRHPFLVVKTEWLRPCCALLRDDESLLFDCCHLISGVDRPEAGQIEVVYHLVSYARKEPAEYRARDGKNDGWVALKVRVDRDDPRVPTVCDIWTGANWHERETYDLMGVVFTGRTDLRRILLPEDWPGHPLRKDWAWPVAYHGIPIVPPEAQ